MLVSVLLLDFVFDFFVLAFFVFIRERRQAWSLVDPLQGPTEEYETDWLTEVRKIGAENYYPVPDL